MVELRSCNIPYVRHANPSRSNNLRVLRRDAIGQYKLNDILLPPIYTSHKGTNQNQVQWIKCLSKYFSTTPYMSYYLQDLYNKSRNIRVIIFFPTWRDCLYGLAHLHLDFSFSYSCLRAWTYATSAISDEYKKNIMAPSQYKDRLIYVWRFPC